MMPFWFKREEGFTIQELMVVMVAGMLLIGMTLSLFLFSRKLFLIWQDDSIMRSTVMNVLQTVRRDIAESGGVFTITDTSLVISERPGKKAIEYRFARGQVFRGDMLLNEQDRPQLAVKITTVNAKDGIRSSCVTLSITARRKAKNYYAELRVSVPQSSKRDFLGFASNNSTDL